MMWTNQGRRGKTLCFYHSPTYAKIFRGPKPLLLEKKPDRRTLAKRPKMKNKTKWTNPLQAKQGVANSQIAENYHQKQTRSEHPRLKLVQSGRQKRTFETATDPTCKERDQRNWIAMQDADWSKTVRNFSTKRRSGNQDEDLIL